MEADRKAHVCDQERRELKLVCKAASLLTANTQVFVAVATHKSGPRMAHDCELEVFGVADDSLSLTLECDVSRETLEKVSSACEQTIFVHWC
jgi:hypothetical protein